MWSWQVTVASKAFFEIFITFNYVCLWAGDEGRAEVAELPGAGLSG